MLPLQARVDLRALPIKGYSVPQISCITEVWPSNCLEWNQGHSLEELPSVEMQPQPTGPNLYMLLAFALIKILKIKTIRTTPIFLYSIKSLYKLLPFSIISLKNVQWLCGNIWLDYKQMTIVLLLMILRPGQIFVFSNVIYIYIYNIGSRRNREETLHPSSSPSHPSFLPVSILNYFIH